MLRIFLLLLVGVQLCTDALAQEPGSITVRKNAMKPLSGPWLQGCGRRADVGSLLDPTQCYSSYWLALDGTYTDSVLCPNPWKGDDLPPEVHDWHTGYWTVVADTLVLRYNVAGTDGKEQVDRYTILQADEFWLRLQYQQSRTVTLPVSWVRPAVVEPRTKE